MAWAWFEGQNIFVAYSKDITPENAIEVSDNITPQDLVVDKETGKLRLKTKEEKLKEAKQYKLQELQTYMANLLSQTDWVVIKLQSLVNEGWSEKEIQAEKEKYREILEQRRRIREWNRQMEQVIQNAQTLEELEGIRIEFIG